MQDRFDTEIDRQDVRVTARWMKRVGWSAKGVVYVLIGVIAIGIALGGGGGEQASPTGAFDALARQPFGVMLLAALMLGLVAYGVARLAEAVRFPPPDGSLPQRLAIGIGGVFYLALAFLATTELIGAGADAQGSGTQSATARVLGLPGGRYLVGAAGVVIVAVAGWMAYRAFADEFMDRLEREEMPNWVTRAVDNVGTWALALRSVSVALVGWFLLVAAVQFDPSQARGLDAALRQLVRQPYGRWLLVLVATGFLAYGLLAFVEARYRKVAGEG